MADNQELLEDFKIYLKGEKNYSPHTIRAYCSDVYSFLLWLNVLNPLELTSDKCSEYLQFIQQINYTKTSIARKIASIRAFYK